MVGLSSRASSNSISTGTLLPVLGQLGDLPDAITLDTPQEHIQEALGRTMLELIDYDIRAAEPVTSLAPLAKPARVVDTVTVALCSGASPVTVTNPVSLMSATPAVDDAFQVKLAL